MLDITSFVREKIFRRPKLVIVTAAEELSEKQTTKLGYFLLYCMFGAILASAQWTLSIIKDIPTAPTAVPGCIISVLDTFDIKHDSYSNHGYNDYEYYNNYEQGEQHDCLLTSENPTFDFTNEYNTVKEAYTSILQVGKSLKILESEKESLEYIQNNTQKDYNTSLTEQIAEEETQVYDRQTVQTNLRESRAKMATLDAQITEQKNSIQSLKSKYNPQVLALKQKIDTADSDYRRAYLLYRLYVALLSFAFSLTIFAILYKMYVAQKIKNSPHTVIFSVATFAY